MNTMVVKFSDAEVRMIMGASFKEIYNNHNRIVFMTDENVYASHREKFAAAPVVILRSGERYKTQSAADAAIAQMLELNIDKTWWLVGAGGGVVTDIAGYTASIYKRGIGLALIPTTILGMTDAAIGGKNGVNVGVYKNMVGTTHQPKLILYDYDLLDTLSQNEWINGFAEVIKHAAIKDRDMFETLTEHNVEYYMRHREKLAALIERNIEIKNTVVTQDEFETGERYLLNFGHTFGHAIENLYALPHGHAISIGMVLAAKFSEMLGLAKAGTVTKLEALLLRYQLPVAIDLQSEALMLALEKDKKRSGNDINFVLLRNIGEATVQPLSLEKIASLLSKIVNDN